MRISGFFLKIYVRNGDMEMIEQETIYQWMNNGNYEEAIKALFNNIEENLTLLKIILMLVLF